MLSKLDLFFCLALISVSSSALADPPKVRECLGEDGKTYKTTQASCPQSMSEVRKKIRSCTLADGSKAFGDKCPQGAETKASIDSEDLSSRDNGLKNQYQNDERRMIQQGESQRYLWRMQQQIDQNIDERDSQIRQMQQQQADRARRNN